MLTILQHFNPNKWGQCLPRPTGGVLALLLLAIFCSLQLNSYSQELTSAKDITVNGKITLEDGSEVPGVSILVKGTSAGTVSNLDGNYTITVPDENATLVLSFVGFTTKEVPVNGRTTIDVVMEEDVQSLEEVVVVGYGTQKKATLTGAVATVAPEKVTSNPSISVSNSLTGLLPGLTAMNTTGQPGRNVSEVLIRGQSTTGDNSPLVVVDGVPDETGAWQRINQNDIEQISVLKDASGAIYGARAANGVILITTKRGTTGKPVLNYSFNQGFVVPTRLPEVVNSWEWANYVNELRVNFQNLEPLYTEEEIQTMRDGSDPLSYPNVDWPNEIFKDYSLQSRHNLSIRGGTESVKYSVSGSYSAENSMAKNGLHEFDGYTLRTNFDADITDYLTFGLSWNGEIDDIVEPEINNFGFETSPVTYAFYPNGLPSTTISDNNYNPALNISGIGGYITNKIHRNRVRPSFELNVPQVEGLGVVGYYSYTNETTENERWREPFNVYRYDATNDEYLEEQGGRVDRPDLRQGFQKFEDHLVHLRVTYDREFGDHNISGFVGAEQSKTSLNFFQAYRRNFLSGAIRELFAGSGQNQEAYGTSSETGRRNLIGRVSWDFQDKYMIDFNARYDGSYAFPKGKRWGFFPGVSAAWNLSRENFMEDINFVDDLKLRGSYGQMGNDKIAPFQFLELSVLNPIGTHFGGGVQGVIIPGVAANPNITWEVATSTNLGLDASFFNRRLGFSVDVFKQRRSNILTPRSSEVPNYTGLILPHENVGIIENEGAELMLSFRSKAGGDFSYSLSGNWAFVQNKIVELSEPQDLLDYQKAEGRVIGAPLLYRAIGIFRTQEEVNSNPVMLGTRVGDLQYEDINGDGLIDAADRMRLDKGTVPEMTFGFNTTIGYKRFTLFANFAGQARAWRYYYERGRPIYNIKRDIYENRYTPGSMDSLFPIMPQESEPGEGEVNGAPSTFWLRDVKFVRLQTLQLGYSVPEKLISRLKISALQIYANGNNLFTLSPMKWYDPAGTTDPDGSTVQSSGGVGYSTGNFYPQTKIFNLGINVTF